MGTFIHNVELYPGKGAQLGRAAGIMAQLMGKENSMALLRLPSGEMRYVPMNCMATIGQVGNIDHGNVKDRQGRPQAPHGLAAHRPRLRHEPLRPPPRRRRGQEPHRPSRPGYPWGKPALGHKTRKTHNRSDKFIVKRRNGK